MTTRALIVDDEPMARRTLQTFAADVPWLHVVGEAADGREAVDQIDALEPDLVFLDIQMPELSGIDVLDRIAHAPLVVFTTAYDAFAVAAFELGALDYLLKPFGRERFGATMDRVERHARQPDEDPAPMDRARWAHDVQHPDAAPLTRFFVRHRDRIVPVHTDAITRLEAQDDYVAVHVGPASYLVHLPLSTFEQRLDPERFVRIHRSHLVNLDHVRNLTRYDATRMLVVLDDGAQIVASRSGSRVLRRLIL